MLPVCGCIALLLCLMARAGETPAAKQQIVVLAWGGPPPAEATVDRFRELAECGFTHSFTGFSNATDMARALDAAQAAGVKLLVSCPELQSDPQSTVRRFMNHPALGGYFLRDEPSAGDFDALAKWTRSIQQADPKHLVYINLFPDYAHAQQLGVPTYEKYVDQFVRKVPVPIISFDYYPIIGKTVRPSWYHNLQVIASAAESAHKPFWAFALSLRHYGYAPATVANLREQVFSDLAYGAQAIEYFTYWASPGLSDDAPIDSHGKRTAVYDHVKQVNAEIRALSPVFLGSKVLWTRHTGDPLPPGATRFKPKPPVDGLSTEGTGAVVSLLEKTRQRFLVIVNRDIERPMSLRVLLDPTTAASEIRKDGSTHPIGSREFSAQCEPGDLRILCWSKP